jgi:uncharacterized DUF497 family protein
MDIEFDPAKRAANLRKHGLDMADAAAVFASGVYTVQDDRNDYGEVRYTSVGYLAGRMVFVAWTPRGEARRIISMRKANDKEQAYYGQHFR